MGDTSTEQPERTGSQANTDRAVVLTLAEKLIAPKNPAAEHFVAYATLRTLVDERDGLAHDLKMVMAVRQSYLEELEAIRALLPMLIEFAEGNEDAPEDLIALARDLAGDASSEVGNG